MSATGKTYTKDELKALLEQANSDGNGLAAMYYSDQLAKLKRASRDDDE